MATRESVLLSKVAAALELQRRGIKDLAKSSKRLERLTRWLIGLTAVLALLTLALACQELGRLIARVMAR